MERIHAEPWDAIHPTSLLSGAPPTRFGDQAAPPSEASPWKRGSTAQRLVSVGAEILAGGHDGARRDGRRRRPSARDSTQATPYPAVSEAVGYDETTKKAGRANGRASTTAPWLLFPPVAQLFRFLLLSSYLSRSNCTGKEKEKKKGYLSACQPNSGSRVAARLLR